MEYKLAETNKKGKPLNDPLTLLADHDSPVAAKKYTGSLDSLPIEYE